MAKIWAIEPHAMLTYLEARDSIPMDSFMSKIGNYNVVAGDENINIKSIFDDQSAEDLLSINGDTASISIVGILTQNGPDLFDRIFGIAGTGYKQLIEAINMVMANEDIKNVRLEMNTPGGDAHGCDAVCSALRTLGEKKSLIAFNNGIVASGGYWLATAADKIISTSPMNETGSIGVILTVLDSSERLEEMGIKIVEFTSKHAPNKNPGISTPREMSLIQERINALERVFISRVAEGRKVTEKTVIETFGKGGVFVAQDPDPKKPDAVTVGMIDEVIAGLKVNLLNNKTNNNIKSQTLKENKMDFKQLCIENSGLKEHVEGLVSDAHQAGVDDANKEVRLRVDYAGPILASDAYKPAVKKLASQVITGESEKSSLESVVTMADIQIEEDKDAQALLDAKDETPPATPKPPDAGIVNDADSYNVMMADINKKQGREETNDAS